MGPVNVFSFIQLSNFRDNSAVLFVCNLKTDLSEHSDDENLDEEE